MQFGETVILLSRLVTGALATLLAIILWSRTRDTAWMFVIIGTVMAYGETVFTALESFGLVGGDLVVISGVSMVRLALTNLPLAFYGVGFAVMILRKELRQRPPKRPRIKPSRETPQEPPQTKSP